MTEGAKVRDGARRRVRTFGRRIGEVEGPLVGTVVPFLDVRCNGKGGGAGEAPDGVETAELP